EAVIQPYADGDGTLDLRFPTTTGNLYRVNLVASYPLNADAPPVAVQNLSFNYCRNPKNGQAEVLGAGDDSSSDVTGFGKKSGIVKVKDDPVQVIPQSPSYDDSFKVIHQSFFEQPWRPWRPSAGKIRLQMDVRTDKQGRNILCSASMIDDRGDRGTGRCASNAGDGNQATAATAPGTTTRGAGGRG
ncbi:MAG TPA: hypothetical protein VKP11_03295, partial [Frankiaceae bacterium]|nr:hypothetical protein [Frankiaceae bacterium]